jgi:hypothetical protein
VGISPTVFCVKKTALQKKGFDNKKRAKIHHWLPTNHWSELQQTKTQWRETSRYYLDMTHYLKVIHNIHCISRPGVVVAKDIGSDSILIVTARRVPGDDHASTSTWVARKALGSLRSWPFELRIIAKTKQIVLDVTWRILGFSACRSQRVSTISNKGRWNKHITIKREIGFLYFGLHSNQPFTPPKHSWAGAG